jgi:hypothetical protein
LRSYRPRKGREGLVARLQVAEAREEGRGEMHHDENITNVTCLLLYGWLGTVRLDVGREAVKFSVDSWGIGLCCLPPLVEMERQRRQGEGVSRVTQ